MKAVLIEVSGTVQGLGFRPFVYNLAAENGIYGFVRNTGNGVQIIVEGKKSAVCSFIKKLKKSEFAAKYSIKKISCRNYKNFKILRSKKTEIFSEFPHDLALCGECKKELFSENNRRYFHPFINCVKCGPRFSIIKKLPYDRKNTSMSEFEICADCRKEYGNPSDRRFHAQPNSCHKCGPRLSLFSSEEKLISEKNKALSDAVKLLKKGKIIAVKSIGGYHLCCDALNLEAIRKLRKRKSRPSKPFAVMTDFCMAENLCRISKYERDELLSDRAPIVLLKKRKSKKYENIFNSLAPDNSALGVMMPYAPLHHLIIKEMPALVMTSGNQSDEPICVNEKEAFKNLSKIADYFLTHNREIENRLDDSIVRFLPGSGEKIIIRRSRGYVPAPVKTNIEKDIFAAGGDLKNNFCFVRKGNAYLSQFTGDLQEHANLKFYEESINKMKSFLDINPQYAVCDAHPGYHSCEYAASRFKKISFAYHHYAHMASVMAEHNLSGNIIGFVFDGNGYGEDGNIWGGEVVLYSKRKFGRIMHFDYFSLPGGDLCQKEVWRTAVSILHKYNLLNAMPKHLKKYKHKTIVKMIENGVNSPLTSSAGRMFDAVAAMTGIKEISSFEAEAAVALESAAEEYKTSGRYKYNIKNNIIDMKPAFVGILYDISCSLPAPLISAKFHNTIAGLIVKIVTVNTSAFKTEKVILGGGVFQNMRLLNTVAKRLLSSGFKIYYNNQVPINDGGICLGQSYIRQFTDLK
ncbi:MAG: carbamoyltransferase HypF [Endomicrobia bacterium]|nr:carbamoyltransferase HypF [Endomicrobiia bacterium]